jgi:hypothetical protein
MTGVQVDAMRIILLALCFAAVGFLLRVLVALALEWSRWPSREKKTDLAGYNPSQVRGNLLVLRPEIPWETEHPRKAAARIGLRA